MIDGIYHTSRIEVDYKGKYSVLGDFLQDEDSVPKEFYINDEELKKWEYKKVQNQLNELIRLQDINIHTQRVVWGFLTA